MTKACSLRTRSPQGRLRRIAIGALACASGDRSWFASLFWFPLSSLHLEQRGSYSHSPLDSISFHFRPCRFAYSGLVFVAGIPFPRPAARVRTAKQMYGKQTTGRCPRIFFCSVRGSGSCSRAVVPILLPSVDATPAHRLPAFRLCSPPACPHILTQSGPWFNRLSSMLGGWTPPAMLPYACIRTHCRTKVIQHPLHGSPRQKNLRACTSATQVLH